MEKYKGYNLQTYHKGRANEISIATDRKGTTAYAAQTDYMKFNSLEKLKAKIDADAPTN